MALTAENITFSYGPRFRIDNVSLKGARGELTGLIGGNGSGKSTLLRIMSGLLAPQSGRVLLLGEPIISYSPNRRARRLAYVPQNYHPVFEFTVEQTVLLGRMPYQTASGGFEGEKDVAVADEVISLLDLEPLRHEPVTDLSGGELQRVLIAKALAQETEVVVLDEPNAHLDPAHQESVLSVIRNRVDERGICAVASIHDLNLASGFCDRLVLISGGRIVHSGTPAEVLTPEILHRAFGVELEVEPNVFGAAPAVRQRFRRREGRHVG